MKAKTWFAILREAVAFDASGAELQTTPIPPDSRVSVLIHERRSFPRAWPVTDGSRTACAPIRTSPARSAREAPGTGHHCRGERPCHKRRAAGAHRRHSRQGDPDGGMTAMSNKPAHYPERASIPPARARPPANPMFAGREMAVSVPPKSAGPRRIRQARA